MPRARSQKQGRPQSTSANDVVNANSTAAHFINYTRPMWLNPDPSTSRIQACQNVNAPRPSQPLAPALPKVPEPAKEPVPAPVAISMASSSHANKNSQDKLGSIHNSIGLPSPVPSCEDSSTRAPLENDQPQDREDITAQSRGDCPNAVNALGTPAFPPLLPHMPARDSLEATHVSTVHVPQRSSALEGGDSPSISSSIVQRSSSGMILSEQTHPSHQHSHHSSGTVQASSHEGRVHNIARYVSITQASLVLYYDVPQCKYKIEQYFKSKTVRNQLPPALADLRGFMLSALDEPIDSFYFLLLQLVCVFTVDPRKLPPVFQNIPNMQLSFTIAGNILASILGFSLEFIRYFASFPKDISQISLLPNDLVAALETFLRLLPGRYQTTRGVLRQRGFSISPAECWSVFAPITTRCSRLLHLHLIRAVFGIRQQDVVASLDSMFVECQDMIAAQLNDSGRCAGGQLRFEALSRSIMHNALLQYGSSLSSPPAASLPIVPSQPPDLPPMPQTIQTQQPAGFVSAVPNHMGNGYILPNNSSTQRPITQHPSPQVYAINNLPAHIQPRPRTTQLMPQQIRTRKTRRGCTTFYATPQQVSLMLAGGTPGHPLLFAPPGSLASSPAEAHPEIYGMHQSHLSDKVIKLDYHHTDVDCRLPLYQAVHELHLAPSKLRFSTAEPIWEWNFDISEDHIKHRPTEETISEYQQPQWRVNRATQIFRFRCAKHVPHKDEEAVSPKTWMDTPTFWPLNCYFTCNGHQLEPRRSNQWHRNLPIDLNSFLKAGQNTIKVFINRLREQEVEHYVGAVECVQLSTAEDIIKGVSQRLRPAKIFVQSLSHRSKSSMMEDDDELSIVGESVQVSVYDPIMAGIICKTPVRSGRCEHKECFDLETFLQSRIKKPGNDVFEADNWLCPICKVYAAPSSLYIDEYFVNVRNDLVLLGRLDTRVIITNQDGTWSIKEEPKEDEQGSKMKGSAEQDSSSTDVIELD